LGVYPIFRHTKNPDLQQKEAPLAAPASIIPALGSGTLGLKLAGATLG